ncbi:Uncaracterized surface protein containing fasciclin (FAS1) repeats [Bizionia echini]|uniref:Uncaracterized surface protein containing fasciclin (FAS1) repeats n=1 Tax=Bizionia echini TaxID=649333 RepID=A0A1I5AKL9_9FLAO|nr:fasciclin domain-containing protein [Bizionia echini]SFN63031.1 Uncaracterized surface protein containing fasciclin (FAS1) repeats [Bizionia echini]
MKNKNVIKSLIVSLMLLLVCNVQAQDKNIVETASGSNDFSTLVAAVKAADLVDVLSSKGPFTVFAPTNAAFNKLPDGTVEGLLKPESKETLQMILKYHVVSGSVMAADVVDMIKTSNGKATIVTVSGNKLMAQMKDGAVYLVDENGNWSKITATDMKTSNGVIHVVDSVLLPK